MKRLRSKLTYANVVSTLCLCLLVGGGTALAASQMLPKNSVGAKQLKKHAVTLAKLSRTTRSELSGGRGATGAPGPVGPQGARGPKGDTGEPATTLLAHVGENGKLIAGSGVTASFPVEKAYEVDFDRDVSGCNYQLTLAGLASSGTLVAEPLEGNPKSVIVATDDHSLKAFYLAVFCP